MNTVFGITGTNGKTSTSYMLRSILLEEGEKVAVIGTISHDLGNKIHEPVNTTPGKNILGQYFSEMKENGITSCIMEVSSHGLDQGRVEDIPFSYVAFTNLTQDHLDYHGTMENYYLAKKKLFTDFNVEGGIINIDDSYGNRLSKELKYAKNIKEIVTISIKERNADVYGKIKERNIFGTEIEVFYKQSYMGTIKINLPGDFSVYNGLTAVGIALCFGIKFQEIVKGLVQGGGIPGRFEIIENKSSGKIAIVDFAHTPHALYSLLSTVKQLMEMDKTLAYGRLITVFGCGGDRDKGKRAIMGEIAGTLSDYCIITNDNPRGETPEDISDNILEGLYKTGCDYSIVLDRYQAIKRAALIGRKGDVIVIAGKGHEAYQLIGKEKKPFDDRLLIRELL